MITYKKFFSKKVLKGIVIFTILYIIVSMVVTKIVYDSIFDRYSSSKDEIFAPYSGEFIDSCEKYSYKCSEYELVGYLSKADEPHNKLIIIVPGFHSVCRNYAGIMRDFSQKGYDVFCFDSTGHGESGGESSVGFPGIISDLRATMEFINNNSDFEYDDIFLFGHSRGGYAACCMINEYDNISGIISINGINSAMDGVMSYSVDAVGRVSYLNYPFLWLYQTIIMGSDVMDLDAYEEICQSSVPSLIIQSEEDEILNEGKYSIYAQQDENISDISDFVMYTIDGKDGHTSVLYDENGNTNIDIVNMSVNFFVKHSQ